MSEGELAKYALQKTQIHASKFLINVKRICTVISVSLPEQTLDNDVFYEATVHSFTLLGQFLEDVQNTDSVQLHRARKTRPETRASSQGESVGGASTHGDKLSNLTGQGESVKTMSTQMSGQTGQGRLVSETRESEQGGGGEVVSRHTQETTVEGAGGPSPEIMDTSVSPSEEQGLSMDVT
jgi:hypothetical protein